MKSGYSYQTSLPAYLENKSGKSSQADRILKYLQGLGGQACIRQIASIIGLPDSTVSGRINDLKKDGLVDCIDTIIYEGRKRKRFFITKKLATQ